MKRIYSTAIVGLTAGFIIFAALVLFSISSNDSDRKFMEGLSLHQKIDAMQIESIRMSKVIPFHSTYKQVDLDLNQQQNQEIIRIFNSIPSESINTVNSIDASISSGIVITLKNKSEVRIQYDKSKIYVSRPEIIYTIENKELKGLFDYELKKNEGE